MCNSENAVLNLKFRNNDSDPVIHAVLSLQFWLFTLCSSETATTNLQFWNSKYESWRYAILSPSPQLRSSISSDPSTLNALQSLSLIVSPCLFSACNSNPYLLSLKFWHIYSEFLSCAILNMQFWTWYSETTAAFIYAILSLQFWLFTLCSSEPVNMNLQFWSSVPIFNHCWSFISERPAILILNC